MEQLLEITQQNARLQTALKQTKGSLTGLDKALSSISQKLKDTFSVKGYADYQQTVSRLGKSLADDLLVLQLRFGKLKSAVADAVAPIVAQVAPWLDAAVQKATEFANTAAGVMQVILGHQAVADSAQDAAEAEEKLASAGKAARRSLMSLDQIQRLNQGSGGSGTAETELEQYTPITVSQRAMEAAQRLMAVLQPLRDIDLTPLLTALAALKDGFGALAGVAVQGLEYLWYQVMTPFFRWVAEEFAPSFTEGWASAMQAAAQVIGPVSQGVQGLFDQLRPVVDFIGQGVVMALEQWKMAFQRLGEAAAAQGGSITGILNNAGTVLAAVWERMAPVLETLRQRFLTTFSQVGQVVSNIAGSILQALYGVSEFLAGAFTGDWKRSWEGIRSYFAGLVNGLIGLLNGMLDRLGSALNHVIATVNKLRFTVPDWVPEIGGQSFGLKMSQVQVPQIPYLAQGAVIPANKPFLAMLGDQSSGTNVEAPLKTIQQAVRMEIDQVMAGMMAGMEASVGVQKEILEAVLGISIGDDLIGAAAERYQKRQAVMRGGVI